MVFSQSKLLRDCSKCAIECSVDEEWGKYHFSRCCISDVPHISMGRYIRPNEYFVAEDTLVRDFISIRNVKYTIDDLLNLKQRDYTISFNRTGVYFISKKDVQYFIIKGFNTFQIGSDQQTYFIILRSVNGKIEFISSYIFDAPKGADFVKVLAKRDVLILKHEKLKRLK